MAIFYSKIENLDFFVIVMKHSKMNYLTTFFLTFFCYKLLRDSSNAPNQWPTTQIDLINYFSYYWVFFLLGMLLFAPNRFTNVFRTRFLKQMGKFNFGCYLWHVHAIYIIKDCMPKTLLNNSLFGLNLNNELHKVILIFVLSYWFGKFYYYLVELHSMKMSMFFCRKLSKLKFSLLKKIFLTIK